MPGPLAPLALNILRGIGTSATKFAARNPKSTVAAAVVTTDQAIRIIENSSSASDPKDDKNLENDREGRRQRVTAYDSSDASKVSQKPPRVRGGGSTNSNSVNEYRQIVSRPNPLSYFSSYTYQITLYMSTPEAVNDFINTGVFNPQDDHFIIAQSGGQTALDKRGLTNSGELGPGQLGMDYYIDDLEIKVVLTGNDGSPTVGTDIKFKIVEPTGFNFFTQLSTLSGEINKRSTIVKNSSNDSKYPKNFPSAIQQNYMIGIRYYGYDENGNLADPTTFQKKSFFQLDKQEAVSKISDYAVYERFFTFVISSVVYTIDGRVVTYQFEGTPASKIIGQGSKFAIVTSAANIIAGNVHDAIGDSKNKTSVGSTSLLDILNDQEQEKTKSGRAAIPNKYSIYWANNTESLQNASLIDDPFFKNQAPPAPVQGVKDGTPKVAAAAQSINPGKKQLSLRGGESVIFIMNQLMAKSSYVSDSISALVSQKPESVASPNLEPQNLSWFSINSVVNYGPRDSITKDWTYNIAYYIDMQRIEYVNSVYVNRTSRWRGAHKKYKYFLTGENTEIVNFEQKYDNQFYLLQAQTASSLSGNGPEHVPAHTQGGTPDTPTASQANQGSLINANVARRINSPADQAQATIRIIGDPDYLTGNIGGINPTIKDTGIMNPYREQIWIEIEFQGSVDYKNDGTLDKFKIDFYDVVRGNTNEDKNKSDVDGMIYQVIGLTHSFSNGRFIQDLDLLFVFANELGLKTESLIPQREDEKSTTSSKKPTNQPTVATSRGQRRNDIPTTQTPTTPPGVIPGAPPGAVAPPKIPESPGTKLRNSGQTTRGGIRGTPNNDDAKPIPTFAQIQEMEKAEAAREAARSADIDRRLTESARQQRDNPRSIYGDRNPIKPPGG